METDSDHRLKLVRGDSGGTWDEELEFYLIKYVAKYDLIMYIWISLNCISKVI